MLKVINTGLGRTGTTSLRLALQRLGYGPSFHMFDIVGDDKRLGQWERIVCEGQTPDWHEIFGGYTSVADGPSAVYYGQILSAFPSAKFILTVRDPESWYRSTYQTLYQFAVEGRRNAPPPQSMSARLFRVVDTMIWGGLFDGRFEDEQHAIDVYRRHNEQVAETIPADQLLVYDVTQGWAPLCQFLGVDVPDDEFPRANDAQSMRRVVNEVGGRPGPS
jgi:hypothetical protein